MATLMQAQQAGTPFQVTKSGGVSGSMTASPFQAMSSAAPQGLRGDVPAPHAVAPVGAAPAPAAAPAPGPFSPQAIAFYNALGKNVPAAPTTINPSYISAFQDAMGQVRGHINNQLATALADIGGNEQAANQEFGQLPSQIKGAYGQANGTVGSSLGTINDAMRAAGVAGKPVSGGIGIGPGVGGFNLSDYFAPERAAMQNSENYQLADVPMQQIAAGQEFARQRAQANLTAEDQQSQLALEAAKEQAAMAQAAQQNSLALQLEQMKEAHDTSMTTQSNLLAAQQQQAAAAQHKSDQQFQAGLAGQQARYAAAGPMPADNTSAAYYQWLQKVQDPQAQAAANQWAGVLNPTSGTGLTGGALNSYLTGLLKNGTVRDPVAQAYLRSRLGLK